MSSVGCCCGHLYHNECIIKWIREAKNCPKCLRTSSVEDIACLSIEDDRVTSLTDRRLDETENQHFEFNQMIEKINDASANNLRINEKLENLKTILENQHGEKSVLLRQIKTMKEQTKELGELLEKERLENARKAKEIEKKNKEIVEKIKDIEEKCKKIDEKDMAIEKKGKEIELKDKEIDKKNKEIEKLRLEMFQLKENVPSQPLDIRQMETNDENDQNLLNSPLMSTEANNHINVGAHQLTTSQIKSVTVRRKFIPKVPPLKRVPIAKKRPAMKVMNGVSPVPSTFGKNKQVPVNVLAAAKPWRPFGTKQHQLIKPSQHNDQTPNNIENTKSAKRKLRLDSPIGSPMYTSTPNNGRKFPAFVIG
ncbi:hypothetical protein ACQ4LE_002565 [Meloidogyne hapla]